VQTALAQTTAIVQTILRFLPQAQPLPWWPFICFHCSGNPDRLTSDSLSEQAIFDFGTISFAHSCPLCRPALPFPYGGKQRQITVDLNSQRFNRRACSPVDIVNAVNAQNLIFADRHCQVRHPRYNVEMNGSPQTIQELNDLPVKTINGATIYMREVARCAGRFSPQTNIVRATDSAARLWRL